MRPLSLRIVHLYPDLLNTYGDQGNVLALRQRAVWRGIQAEVLGVTAGMPLDMKGVDILCLGGGEDGAQEACADDLQARASALRRAVEDGLVVLAVCAGYQLLARRYVTAAGRTVPGLGIFPAETVAGHHRLVGDLRVQPTAAALGGIGPLIGFENHGGRSRLERGAEALGKVLEGHGNNGQDGTEGAMVGNCLGTYLHGALLPKNPDLADWLLRTALVRRYGQEVALPPLDDRLEDLARAALRRRARKRWASTPRVVGSVQMPPGG